MNRINKILSLVIVIALCMCLGSTAFAADTIEESTHAIMEETDLSEVWDSIDYVAISPLADSSIIYQFSESNWCPALGAYGEKAKAQSAGTLRIAIAAACRNPGGVHSGETIQVKVISGIVTLATITVPVDGKLHVYRFNGNDYKKVNIVKGNNYTTKISGSSNCLLMAISGYVAAE